MKRVLYITDVEAPYRTVFFNCLAEQVELDVLCECKTSSKRDKSWTTVSPVLHNIIFLGEERYKKREAIGIKMLWFILRNRKKYDEILFGCVNSKPQMFTYKIMQMLKMSYSLNFDGETMFDDIGLKRMVKSFFIKGANKYYFAGEKALESTCAKLKIDKQKAFTYYFSSLTDLEISVNNKKSQGTIRQQYCLVVGRFFPYKGLDIAVEVAKEFPQIHFKFVGMGDRAKLLKELLEKTTTTNVEVIPFLNKQELEKEYLECGFMLLPSRRECWGLVVNEAASYGCPIIATIGSGAAVEFLADKYEFFLANIESVESLKKCINKYYEMSTTEVEKYSSYLLNKTKQYSIEKSVEQYVKGIAYEDFS